MIRAKYFFQLNDKVGQFLFFFSVYTICFPLGDIAVHFEAHLKFLVTHRPPGLKEAQMAESGWDTSTIYRSGAKTLEKPTREPKHKPVSRVRDDRTDTQWGFELLSLHLLK